MTLDDLKNEAISWRFTKYKLINLTIGLLALLLYEFVGQPYYRPFIYSHNIYDFHIADTLGNSLGTMAAIFIPIAILTNDKTYGYSLIKLITIIVVIYEIGQPLLGKSVDFWDIFATVLSGGISYLVFKWLFSKAEKTNND
jgi:hypothetical protein